MNPVCFSTLPLFVIAGGDNVDIAGYVEHPASTALLTEPTAAVRSSWGPLEIELLQTSRRRAIWYLPFLDLEARTSWHPPRRPFSPRSAW